MQAATHNASGANTALVKHQGVGVQYPEWCDTGSVAVDKDLEHARGKAVYDRAGSMFAAPPTCHNSGHNTNNTNKPKPKYDVCESDSTKPSKPLPPQANTNKGNTNKGATKYYEWTRAKCGSCRAHLCLKDDLTYTTVTTPLDASTGLSLPAVVAYVEPPERVTRHLASLSAAFTQANANATIRWKVHDLGGGNVDEHNTLGFGRYVARAWNTTSNTSVGPRDLQSLEMQGKGQRVTDDDLWFPLYIPGEPPVLDAHRPVWARWGDFTHLPAARYLHNLEHGGVTFLYDPCYPDLQRQLTATARRLRNTRLGDEYWGGAVKYVVTPYVGLATRFAVLTWGHGFAGLCDPSTMQVALDSFLERTWGYSPESVPQSGDYTLGWTSALGWAVGTSDGSSDTSTNQYDLTWREYAETVFDDSLFRVYIFCMIAFLAYAACVYVHLVYRSPFDRLPKEL